MSRKNRRPSKAISDDRIGYYKNQVNNLLNQKLNRGFSVKQIIKKLNVRDKASKLAVTQAIYELEQSEKIVKLRNNSYKSVKKPDTLIGTIDYVNPKFGYVVLGEEQDDVWVKSEDMKFALNGDTVKVVVHKVSKKGKPEGKVVEILERARTEFVGRIEVSPNYAFVVPDNRKMHHDVFVAQENIGKAKKDDKVVVEIKEWPSSNRNPVGIVKEVLGKAGENEAEIHSIMAEFGLPFRFPTEIEQEAKKVKEGITQSEIKKRRDFREITTFTIDPIDAKDFDDALSYEKLDNGNIEVGIHIADVSHYVRPGSILDEEAQKRATSVYLVDRTIPMLPENISNGICSLRPEEEKLTFSAVFELNENAEVKNSWYGRTVIFSDRRFTYEEAQERIESSEGDFSEQVVHLNELAKKIRAKRFKQGAVNFETTEVKFELDKNGKPLRVVPKVRKDAHKLVEEFMLLANRSVAEYVNKLQSKNEPNTFVYRVHENPDPEKLDSFAKFAKRFGHDLNFDKGEISGQLNTLMGGLEGKPEENVLQSLAVRSMAKARYTIENKGHFGLAFPFYTHFTSPIRRYPDVMVHRLLWNYLKNNPAPKKEPYEKDCLHSSEREKNAADSERASIKYKQVEFMSSMLGEDFEGIVSGVTEWGLFVEITETKCEGMVRISDIDDDFYEFDEKNYCIIGLNNKKIITLGDKLTVKVVKTDIDRRTIDLDLVYRG
ncbi:MAG: ribonuclease R [Bacteroidota bacterium]